MKRIKEGEKLDVVLQGHEKYITRKNSGKLGEFVSGMEKQLDRLEKRIK